MELEERGNNEGLDYVLNMELEERGNNEGLDYVWREETMKALTTCAQHGTGGERKQ